MSESTAPVQNHWIEDEPTRKRFWMECQKLTGLTGKALETTVHVALGNAASHELEHVRGFAGTLEQALAAVATYVREAVAAYANINLTSLIASTAGSLPEAVGRLSTKVVSAHGGVHLVTVSAFGSNQAERRTLLAELADFIALMDEGFPARGLAFLADGRDSLARPLSEQQVPARPATPHAAQERAAGADIPARIRETGAQLQEAVAKARPQVPEPVADVPIEDAPPPEDAAPAASNLITFPLETVVVQNTPNGKRFYRVLGGRWKKFGGTCWPEVFEAVFDAAGWEVGSEHPIEPGLTAYCEPDAKGQPRKCIRIE